MQTLLRDSLRSAFSSALLILKYVVPFYLLADILDHFDLLRHLGFLFAPLTGLLDLPTGAAVALAVGGQAAAAQRRAVVLPSALCSTAWRLRAPASFAARSNSAATAKAATSMAR